MAPGQRWSRDELVVACFLYRYPVGKKSEENRLLVKITGRSLKSVSAIRDNFASLDPNPKTSQAWGHIGSLGREVWYEFDRDPKGMSDLALRLILENESLTPEDRSLLYVPGEGSFFIEDGMDEKRMVNVRKNQWVVRRNTLELYGGRCCATGIANPNLLRASHIKPWSVCTPKERTDLGNALCLNVTHDALFDRFLMTVDPEYRIHYAPGLERTVGEEYFEESIAKYDRIRINHEFPPGADYLEYHNRRFTERTGEKV